MSGERPCDPYPEYVSRGIAIEDFRAVALKFVHFSAFWPVKDNAFSCCSIMVCIVVALGTNGGCV